MKKPNFLMIRLASLIFFCLIPLLLSAQFPPAANQPSSTAIHKTSPTFINWAKTAEIERGEQNISDDSLNYAEIGEAIFATGAADNQIVSLGDNGAAILTFDPPITNGTGADFAVFENGFPTLGGYFLELAFVEVSSDGVFFARFPATSLTDTSRQIGSFDLIDPTKINNLAGKYASGYGTPFDLEELAKIPEVDISNITHIKIIDVVGSLVDSLARYDVHGNKINDPFPTPFPSGGFDLDAIGVIHQKTSTNLINNSFKHLINIFPNPLASNDLLNIQLNAPYTKLTSLQLFTANGVLLKNISVPAANLAISLDNISAGIYWLKIDTHENSTVKKIVVLE